MQRLVAVQLGQPAQLELGLLARGDVAADALDADRAAVLLDHAARDLEDHGVAVLGDELLLERRPRDLARELALGRAQRRLERVGRQVVGEVRADQLGAGVAEHALERAR